MTGRDIINIMSLSGRVPHFRLRVTTEVTVIDRQKYVAELGKLLSGMVPQDREAVLRGVNARFDEEGDDAAVIASLGSPTFAAVSVLRGYVPPEEGASDSVPMPEPRRARPEPKPVEPEPAEPGSQPESEPETPEAPKSEAEAVPAEADGPSPDEPAPEAESVEAADIEAEVPAEPEPVEPAAETVPEPEAPEQPEIPAASEEAEEPEEPGQAEVHAEADEPEQAEDVERPEASEAEAEVPVEAEEAETPEEADENPELPPFWGGPPELPKPPKAKVGLLILYIILGVVVGLPLTVLFACVALGIFAGGAGLIGAAALLVSFCFLGMSVVADILLLAGSALVLAALGLLLLFFAVWFFLRCVVGFADLIIKKGRDWCYERGEVDG